MGSKALEGGSTGERVIGREVGEIGREAGETGLGGVSVRSVLVLQMGTHSDK
ncbi:unnamed protein product, partial [Ilex paraguariensis]